MSSCDKVTRAGGGQCTFQRSCMWLQHERSGLTTRLIMTQITKNRCRGVARLATPRLDRIVLSGTLGRRNVAILS